MMRRALSHTVTNDPRTATIYARRVSEHLVEHLYELWELEAPYRADFSAPPQRPSLQAPYAAGDPREARPDSSPGHNAVHRQVAIPTQVGISVLSNSSMCWSGRGFITHRSRVRCQSTHSSIPRLPHRSHRFHAAKCKTSPASSASIDANYAAAVAAKNDQIAARDAEIARLQEQIAAAQATSTHTDRHDYREADTRKALIDELLHEAGWTLANERDREFRVAGMPNDSGVGYIDYVLWGDDGSPIAIVEAKRTTSSPQIGEQQASLYADRLQERYGRRPVIFTTNGYEHTIWDDAGGYPPRRVDGFYTKSELDLLVQRRHTRRPLSTAPINAEIAGRPYQQRAIRAVGDAFDRPSAHRPSRHGDGLGQRPARRIALVDQLIKQDWVKRVLFLADRTSLVKQATRAFTTHLSDTTTVNLSADQTGDGRVFAATYPRMLNLINEVTDGSRRFTPGYFDLIVIDEAHRSVYDKYGAIFDYFDGLLVGLTATPKNEIDRNTYSLFDLEDGVPTDAYTLEEAVADGFLVPPRGVSVESQFLRQGIRYDDLPPEARDQWDPARLGRRGHARRGDR